MHPEFTAYKISPHSHVACVDCHIGSERRDIFSAKLNAPAACRSHPIIGAFRSKAHAPNYPTPIPSPVENLRPARAICENCHTPARYVGEKLLVKSSFADDEKNTETQTVLVLHLGGVDSFFN